ncbi:Mitochondrial inner membrane translocase complex isoform 2 [Capsicum annuum]|nr:Mitochondrial inner membrane translocase complex isoform 2 [Capsicum annuum]
MALGRYHSLRNIYQTLEIRHFSTLLGSSRSNSKFVTNVPHITLRSISSCMHKDHGGIPWTSGDKTMLRSTTMQDPISYGYMRSVTTQAKAPAQARKMGAVKVSMLSPGIIYEPYAPREKIPFWKRYFTRNGWKRTKEDLTSELKSAYAIAKLRKAGYSKQKFYTEAVSIYKEALKNEIKQRESVWPTVYWELIEPIVKIGVDRDDLSKVFIQLTLEFLSKQKFEAYDAKGAVVSGDRNKEVLVRDIWVFEKSLFHTGAYWRLCGRIKV